MLVEPLLLHTLCHIDPASNLYVFILLGGGGDPSNIADQNMGVVAHNS